MILLIVIGLLQLVFIKDKNYSSIAYKNIIDPDEPTIVFLHGSPGSASDFDKLVPMLEGRNLIVVDLPGFGNNQVHREDYSIESAADYLYEELQMNNVSEPILFGYSWGGGVAMHYASKYPIKSVILYASMGIIEGEATGNHIGEQIRAYVSYLFVVYYPGSLFMDLNHRKGFIRSFMDNDLREMPEVLSKIKAPVLIINGEDDLVVPLWIAQKHAKLISNSNLQIISGGHGQIFENPSEIVKTMEVFIDELE